MLANQTEATLLRVLYEIELAREKTRKETNDIHYNPNIEEIISFLPLENKKAFEKLQTNKNVFELLNNSINSMGDIPSLKDIDSCLPTIKTEDLADDRNVFELLIKQASSSQRIERIKYIVDAFNSLPSTTKTVLPLMLGGTIPLEIIILIRAKYIEDLLSYLFTKPPYFFGHQHS